MANFTEHIDQAKRNLTFLKSINQIDQVNWDWQVTAAFYTAVHLINAHLAHTANLHYRSHKRVDEAINPYYPLSITKLEEEEFLAYKKLQGLARRSRYLCNDNQSNKSTENHFTYDKHFSKAVKNLDKIIKWISAKYSITFEKHDIKCLELKGLKSDYFQVVV